MTQEEIKQNFDEKPEVKGCRGCWFFENDKLEKCLEIVPFCRGIIYVTKQPNQQQ